jgi:hypothetical protein
VAAVVAVAAVAGRAQVLRALLHPSSLVSKNLPSFSICRRICLDGFFGACLWCAVLMSLAAGGYWSIVAAGFGSAAVDFGSVADFAAGRFAFLVVGCHLPFEGLKMQPRQSRLCPSILLLPLYLTLSLQKYLLQ